MTAKQKIRGRSEWAKQKRAQEKRLCTLEEARHSHAPESLEEMHGRFEREEPKPRGRALANANLALKMAARIETIAARAVYLEARLEERTELMREMQDRLSKWIDVGPRLGKQATAKKSKKTK